MNFAYPGLLAGTPVRLLFLLAGLVVYGALSSPTPDDPGWAEVFVGLMLLAAGWGSLPRLLRVRAGEALYFQAGRFFLFYGLCVMLLAGVIAGNGLSQILRDFIPFMFLLLPLFVADLFNGAHVRFQAFLATAIISGVLFAYRATPLAGPMQENDFLYLANAPTVLLAATLPVGWALRDFMVESGWRRFVRAILCLLLAALPLLAMALSLQRASFGLIAIYALSMTAVFAKRRPRRVFFMGAALVLLVMGMAALSPGFALFLHDIGFLIEALRQKNAMVGLNNRTQEFLAVWNHLQGYPAGFLLGGGWGATFESPAVGGARVNFTHNLLSSLLLKGGVMGALLGVLYLGGIAAMLWRAVCCRPLLGLALAAPFLIDVTLYASFKSLDFGVLLTLIVACAQLQENGNSCKT